MNLDTGTLVAILIALIGSITMMGLFWKENIELTKRNRILYERIKTLQK